MLQQSMTDNESRPLQDFTFSNAPTLPVKTRTFSSIEHPFIIRDTDKCVKSLGGPHRLKELVKSPSDAKSHLYYRPGDRMTEPLQSSNVQTKDLLLKITVPKRTGLKRKRGTSVPYTVGDEGTLSSTLDTQNRLPPEPNAKRLLRSLAENSTRCQVNVLGTIDHTHRFRGMPDFVLSTANSSFMRKMRDNILPFEYEKLKSFEFDMSRGAQRNTDIIPPPNWSHYNIPFNFAFVSAAYESYSKANFPQSYRQNPSVRHFTDEQGNFSTINIHASQKALSQSVPYEISEVPTGPSPKLPPLDTLEPRMQQLVAEAKTVIENRPIFTRRALQNSLSKELWRQIGSNSAKNIFHYVGYFFISGPWRDAVVKFGVDPRTDPKYRVYQTIMLIDKIDPRESRFKSSGPAISNFEMEPVPSEESHLFNGKTYSKDCKEWQVCDISDPIVSEILRTDNLRSECQIDSGWYLNGTWAKAKVLTKSKMIDLSLGLVPAERMYKRLAKRVPDVITRKDFLNELRESRSSVESRLLSVIRSSALNYRRGANTGMTKTKTNADDRPGVRDADGEDEGGGDDDEAGDREEEEEEVDGMEIDLIDPDLENVAADSDNDEESQEEGGDGESTGSEPRA